MIVKDFNRYIVDASKSNHIIPGFNVFGYEYAVGVIEAAEKMKSPVLLMINRLAVDSMDVECWGSMLNHIAQKANVCVGMHLDHMSEIDKIQRAIDSGFTSVMYDGSQLDIDENIENTRKVVDMARKSGVFVEAEIGSVPYDDMPGKIKDELATASRAKYFAENSGCDWLAVAVGNIHRLVDRNAAIDFDRIKSFGENLDIPLVIHGATGISDEDMKRLTTKRITELMGETHELSAISQQINCKTIQLVPLLALEGREWSEIAKITGKNVGEIGKIGQLRKRAAAKIAIITRTEKPGI